MCNKDKKHLKTQRIIKTVDTVDMSPKAGGRCNYYQYCGCTRFVPGPGPGNTLCKCGHWDDEH